MQFSTVKDFFFFLFFNYFCYIKFVICRLPKKRGFFVDSLLSFCCISALFYAVVFYTNNWCVGSSFLLRGSVSGPLVFFF